MQSCLVFSGCQEASGTLERLKLGHRHVQHGLFLYSAFPNIVTPKALNTGLVKEPFCLVNVLDEASCLWGGVWLSGLELGAGDWKVLITWSAE